MRIREILKGDSKVLNIYFTAGYPHLNDTEEILMALDKAGVQMAEVGIPFSDPLADGPVIQASSLKAIQNGITLKKIFEQLQQSKGKHQVSTVLMGYINSVLQYGVEAFLKSCQEVGVEAVIIPDLSLEIYERSYQQLFEQYGVALVFLVTPQTEEARIRKIDDLSKAFIYVVSTSSTTGNQDRKVEDATAYLNRIAAMNLKTPTMVGFNIKDKATFQLATQNHQGGIIGSAFVKDLNEEDLSASISSFIQKVLS